MKTFNWKYLIILISIIYFVSIVLFVDKDEKYWDSVALGGMMVILWFFEAIPIYITALLPVVFALPLGILDKDQLAVAYGNEFVYLFLGGFILALAMEKWDVHKQIAHAIIRYVGSSKSRLILGFLLSTGILSMWISNTATALMMLPMATAITHNLPSQKSKFSTYLLLSVAYAASIGGMATLVGSPTNSMMAGVLKQYNIEVSFTDWMMIGLPVSLLMLAMVYIYFNYRMGKERKHTIVLENVKQEPWTKDQLRVILLFLCVVFFWSFHELITKWTGLKYSDQNVAILGAVLMFIIPSSDKKPLLIWSDTRNLSWGILLLFGGGFALAKMMEVNGVIVSLTNVFELVNGWGILMLILLLVTIAIFGTEFLSNTALVAVFVPVVAAFAESYDLPILTLCAPVALASSCAFMLPVGTPPNAIVFSSGQLTISQMARNGLVFNLIGVVVITLMAYFLLK